LIITNPRFECSLSSSGTVSICKTTFPSYYSILWVLYTCISLYNRSAWLSRSSSSDLETFWPPAAHSILESCPAIQKTSTAQSLPHAPMANNDMLPIIDYLIVQQQWLTPKLSWQQNFVWQSSITDYPPTKTAAAIIQ
jgi:hypothetical protein